MTERSGARAPCARIRVRAAFHGPPDSGNGGYSAGLIATAIGRELNVRLVRRVPLERELEVIAVEEARWEVRAEGATIATAAPATLSVDVPEPVPYVEAVDVSRHYAGFEQHAFPQCFVCGPQRPVGEGLRIFPGDVPGRGIVAAPWTPAPALESGGAVRPEFIWAALDCPGYFASGSAQVALLGELAVRIERPVHAGERCVVIGWPLAIEGRKHRVGTALFGEHGACCAFGVATWIRVAA